MRIHHWSNEVLHHIKTHQQAWRDKHTHTGPVLPMTNTDTTMPLSLLVSSFQPQLQPTLIAKQKMQLNEFSGASLTVGTHVIFTHCSGVCLIPWERRGTTFPVASRHCYRAVKQPVSSKTEWGVARLGPICKAIGRQGDCKIIRLCCKTKCLLNHFKVCCTLWWMLPPNLKISWGRKLDNPMKFNKLIIITTLSKTLGRRWLLSCCTRTINTVTVGHYVAITWTVRDNCTSEEQWGLCPCKACWVFLCSNTEWMQ